MIYVKCNYSMLLVSSEIVAGLQCIIMLLALSSCNVICLLVSIL